MGYPQILDHVLQLPFFRLIQEEAKVEKRKPDSDFECRESGRKRKHLG
jgi:hypothetical protein